jgi:hypothetical protein
MVTTPNGEMMMGSVLMIKGRRRKGGGMGTHDMTMRHFYLILFSLFNNQ